MTNSTEQIDPKLLNLVIDGYAHEIYLDRTVRADRRKAIEHLGTSNLTEDEIKNLTEDQIKPFAEGFYVLRLAVEMMEAVNGAPQILQERKIRTPTKEEFFAATRESFERLCYARQLNDWDLATQEVGKRLEEGGPDHPLRRLLKELGMARQRRRTTILAQIVAACRPAVAPG
jgi:hypothetical protein